MRTGEDAPEERVWYNGEWMPKSTARDWIHERAAILEYDAGLNREEAEKRAREGLRRGKPGL